MSKADEPALIPVHCRAELKALSKGELMDLAWFLASYILDEHRTIYDTVTHALQEVKSKRTSVGFGA